MCQTLCTDTLLIPSQITDHGYSSHQPKATDSTASTDFEQGLTSKQETKALRAPDAAHGRTSVRMLTESIIGEISAPVA